MIDKEKHEQLLERHANGEELSEEELLEMLIPRTITGEALERMPKKDRLPQNL